MQILASASLVMLIVSIVLNTLSVATYLKDVGWLAYYCISVHIRDMAICGYVSSILVSWK